MKRKLFRSYYSRMTWICCVSVFCMVSFALILILVSLNSRRVAATLEKYDKILEEMAQNYKDIWGDYYTIFMPIKEEYNAKSFRDFCISEGTGYERSERVQGFERIMQEICNEDKRITGIYFRRCADEKCYVYFRDDRALRGVSLVLEGAEGAGEANRALLGGRIINVGWMTKDDLSDSDKRQQKEDEAVFGIQSQVLSAKGGKDTDYQITILYDMSAFEDILAKYDLDLEPDARFLLTSQQGMILYDSWGEYAFNQISYFENMENIIGEEYLFTEDEITYRKKTKSINKGGCLVFYIVPERTVTAFQFSGMANMVLLVAITINAVVIIIMFSMNRLVGRKFHELDRGMRQIGKNNLSYRMQVGSHEDEFTRIAVRFNKMCDELEEIINKNYVFQVLQRNAEYKALQTKVNPHFLYNSLEAVREKLLKSGQGDESEMILLLSRIFEYQIRGDSVVTIQKEKESLQNYIDFCSIRYQYSFDYSIDFEDEILDFMVPKHIFQPIMENYFVHGFRDDGTDCIFILGYLDERDHMIHICFCDNGKGMSGEEIETLTASLDEKDGDNSHIGIRNVHNRLKIAFEKGRVEIVSNAPEPGVSISLVFGKELKILL